MIRSDFESYDAELFGIPPNGEPELATAAGDAIGIQIDWNPLLKAAEGPANETSTKSGGVDFAFRGGQPRTGRSHEKKRST